MNLWTRFRQVARHPATAIAATIFILFVQPPVEEHWKGSYMLPVGISLENVAMAVLVLYAVLRYESPLGILLNSKLLRHLGVISYSLYLWRKQLFTCAQPLLSL